MSKMEEIKDLEDYAFYTGYTDFPIRETISSTVSPPTAPMAGDVWLNTADRSMYVYSSTEATSDWIQVGGSAK